MKNLSICILFLLSTVAQAQVKVLTAKQAIQQGLTTKLLDSLYESEVIDRKSMLRGVAMTSDTAQNAKKNAFDKQMWDEEMKMHRCISSYAEEIFSDSKLKTKLLGNLYVNKAGHFDYLVVDVMKANNSLVVDEPSQANAKLLIDSLVRLTQHYQWKMAVNKPRIINIHIPLGYRFVAKKAGQIAEIEDAIKTTMPDTVKILSLHQLKLTEVPAVVYRFKNLEELNLSRNNFKTVMIDAAQLPKLKQLLLLGCQLDENNIQITTNTNLRMLNIQSNKMNDIPAAARNCKGLTSLWMGGNPIKNLNNQSFRSLRQLQDLNFYQSGITNLPNGIAKLRRLEILDLYYNNLQKLPKSVVRLKKLQQLAISHNQLTVLPKRLKRLKNLETLYSHHNKIEKMPGGLVNLQKLKTLDLGYNQITHFPDFVSQLPVLEEFEISSNNISELPPDFARIKNLQKFFVRNNPVATDSTLQEKSKPLFQILAARNVEVFK